MNNSVCSKKVESNWSKQKSKTLSNKVEKFISNSCVDLMPLCKNFFLTSPLLIYERNNFSSQVISIQQRNTSIPQFLVHYLLVFIM